MIQCQSFVTVQHLLCLVEKDLWNWQYHLSNLWIPHSATIWFIHPVHHRADLSSIPDYLTGATVDNRPQSADSIKMRWESFKSLYKRITIHTGRQKQLGCRWGMWLLSWVLISFTTLYAAKCLWYVIKPLCLNVEAIKTHSALGWCIKCYCCCLVYLCLQNTTNISDISIYQATLQTAH